MDSSPSFLNKIQRESQLLCAKQPKQSHQNQKTSLLEKLKLQKKEVSIDLNITQYKALTHSWLTSQSLSSSGSFSQKEELFQPHKIPIYNQKRHTNSRLDIT